MSGVKAHCSGHMISTLESDSCLTLLQTLSNCPFELIVWERKLI